ncbi:MAG: prepilin-type N-terminal cleavage/methylation domain-containing protein [Candidatus Aminicenantes bacterium]|nr:prepilin-type N-terminal cleavage/methylation domain-containing protein [Candidatus Aminicenantes bacterium]
MMLKRKRKEEGFTLVEVLVTIVVVAVALMALLSVFIYGFNLLSRMKQTAIATQCAQEELENIRNLTFDEILALGPSFTNDSLTLLENSSGVRTIEDSVGADIKKLTISVFWTYRGQSMRKDIVTYITREGINKK